MYAFAVVNLIDALITYCAYVYLDMSLHLWITTPCLSVCIFETYGYGLTVTLRYDESV
jgi:hypothetical protein